MHWPEFHDHFHGRPGRCVRGGRGQRVGELYLSEGVNVVESTALSTVSVLSLCSFSAA
jgi:hypothetical protein